MMTPEEAAFLADMGRVSRLNAIQVCVLLIVYGIYLSLFPLSVFIILSRRLRRTTVILLGLTFIVFVATTMRALSFICFLTSQMKNFYMTSELPLEGRRDYSSSEFHVIRAVTLHVWTYPINIIITDAIVVARAWKLWDQWAIRAMLAISLLASAAMSIVFPSFSTMHHFPYNRDPEIGSEIAVSSIFLSFGVNFLATSLIAAKAWKHRFLMSTIFKASDGTARVQKTMILLVETGAGFASIQVVHAIVYLLTTEELSTLNIVRVCLQESMFVLGAIYPTLMLIITSHHKSSVLDSAAEIETQSIPQFVNGTQHEHHERHSSHVETSFSDLFHPPEPEDIEFRTRSSTSIDVVTWEKSRSGRL